MATYKQRTPLARHSHIDQEDNNHDTIQHHHQHYTSHSHSTHCSATLTHFNGVNTPGHQQHQTSAYNGLSSSISNYNNETLPSTTTLFENTTFTSDQEWTSIGELAVEAYSSSSQRKARQRQQQQQRAQEWQFILNQPSRRRQLQLQQFQQQKKRAPLSITLNDGGSGDGGGTGISISSITVAASGDNVTSSFFADEEEREEEDAYFTGFSTSSSAIESPLVIQNRRLGSGLAHNSRSKSRSRSIDGGVEGGGVGGREGVEDGEEPASLSSPSGMRRKIVTLSTTDERRMRLKGEVEGVATTPSTAATTAEKLTAPPVSTGSPMMFLSDDTASSFDFAFSDLTSEHEGEDRRSIWSHDDGDEMESYYSSPSPYTIAGYPPFGYGYHSSSSPFKKTSTTISTASPSATSYTSAPLLQPRRFPSSLSGASLLGSMTTPFSSSNSLSQLLFQPTLPSPQLQQPQQQFGREWSRFQTHQHHQCQGQMPFHDGSGNFILSPSSSSPLLSPHHNTGTTALSSEVSESESDLELDQYPRHHAYQHPIWGRRPLVSAIKSKRMMMMTMKERKLLKIQRLHPSINANRRVRSVSPSPSSSRSHCGGGETAMSRLWEGIGMSYDSEEEEDMRVMEEMNAMVVDIPTTMGWMQVFEQALSTFQSSFEVELLDSSDFDTAHPIKAWAKRNEDATIDSWGQTKYSVTATTPTGATTPTPKKSSSMSLSMSTPSMNSPKLCHESDMIQVKRQMSASSLYTLQRLQSQRYQTQHQHQRHPTQRHKFPRTQAFRHHHHHYDSASEDESGLPSSSTATLLEVAISALRRFRDHVKSNLMDPALDEELDSDLSRLGFGGDLGMAGS